MIGVKNGAVHRRWAADGAGEIGHPALRLALATRKPYQGETPLDGKATGPSVP